MMRKSLIKLALISSLTVAGCSTDSSTPLPDIQLINWEEVPGIYRIPIRQGNLVTQQMVNGLKLGMSKQQVSYLLGTPSIQDIFNEERWDYLYTFRPGSRTSDTKLEQQRLALHFENDQLHKIEGDLLPQNQEAAEITREENRERTIVVPADAPRALDEKGFLGGLLTNTAEKSDEPVLVNKDGQTSTKN